MSSAPVLICVGNSPGTQKLITTGTEFARDINAPVKFLQITQLSNDDETNKRNSVSCDMVYVSGSDLNRDIETCTVGNRFQILAPGYSQLP